MEIADFEQQADSFAREVEKLLDSCLPNQTTFDYTNISSDNLRATFRASKDLIIQPTRSSNRASLSCEYRLCANSTGKHLAVESSSFKINFRAAKRPVPIVRFEYDRQARNKPVSHFQFHADSVSLALLLAMGGHHDKAAQQQDVHFPMGGHRFRVCIEDVIELAIREFNAASLPDWNDHVRSSRRIYRERQVETIIRKNLTKAIAILKEHNFTIDPPDDFESVAETHSDEW